MLINIKVIPNAKREQIKKTESGLRVYVNTPPEGGRANKAVIKLLSKELDVPKSKIEIISGEKSREKIIKINR
ncbi:MAG: hypothetical protein COU51_00825 [Parcubacteria group bacterium CG10_big_fil_rev_8_21_14_0_10_36_14]|nr:MAG: hypothetical protein COU51_00825 [Parcubacteria group bacterium CG10_big_fil_rev_8_21_14_0_10_36_14]